MPRLVRFSVLLASIVTGLLHAQTISITPEHASGLFQPGQTVRWQISVTNAASLRTPTYTIKSGGLTTIASGALTLTDGRATLASHLDEPGWLLLEVDGTNATGAAVQAFGGALVGADRITPAEARPGDFDAFWQGKLDELATVPINPVVTPGSSGRAGVDYATVQLDCIHGAHVQGQLARPTAGNRFPALLIVQWAGVYSLQKSWATDRAADGWLVLNTQAHDIAPIESDAYYQALSNGSLNNYPHVGNDDRETSYFLRMYLACHRAAEYLTTRPDWDGRTLVVMGASQGGLQALVTGALHPKVTAVIAEVPAGSDQAGLDVGRVPGWPVWAWQAWDRDAARVRQAARYYDVTHFAPLIHCPVLIGVGLIDTVVPPPGVFATYNLLPGARQIVAMPAADHQNNHNAFYAPQNAWLADAKTGRAPTIRVAPQPASARVGESVTFSVLAGNGQACGYQWLRNGTPVVGATSSRLTLNRVAPGDAADYTVAVTSAGGSVTSNAARLTIADGAPRTPSSLANIATRADCGLGINVAVGGFVVTGPAVKRVLVRAVGPTLTTQGIGEAEVLRDPTLEVHDAHGDVVIATNDNWGDNANAAELLATAGRVGATSLASTDFTSSAMLLDLPGGIYTFVVRGQGASTGIVLLEVYDADDGVTGMRFADIASRARARTGNGVAIGGFVVSGGQPKRVLMRAVGPTLTTQGIAEADVLRDPEIELHDARNGNAIIRTNSNWGAETNAAAIVTEGARIGATPFSGSDATSSALLMTLDPGVYSFIARGQNDAAGVVLVEVYDAD
jgi:cephalosporin-C deacetylase-like acetyl esterase